MLGIPVFNVGRWPLESFSSIPVCWIIWFFLQHQGQHILCHPQPSVRNGDKGEITFSLWIFSAVLLP